MTTFKEFYSNQLLVETWLDVMFHDIDMLNIDKIKMWRTNYVNFAINFNKQRIHEIKLVRQYEKDLKALNSVKYKKGIKLNEQEKQEVQNLNWFIFKQYKHLSLKDINNVRKQYPWEWEGREWPVTDIENNLCSREGNIPIHFSYNGIYTKNVFNLLKPIAAIAYKMLIYFSELEYKLFQVQKNKFENLPVGVVGDIERYMLKLYDWLKEFMLGVIEFRVAFNPSQIKSRSIHNNFEPKTKNEIEAMQWSGMSKCMFMLNNAKTLKEKIVAITATINVWHHRDSLFTTIPSEITDSKFNYKYANNTTFFDPSWVPFTNTEYEAINNKLNHRKLDNELAKEVY